MDTWLLRSVAFLGLMGSLSACGTHPVTDAGEARTVADSALKKYCDSFSEECTGLKFVRASDFNERWLVEYESKQYLYAVIVGVDGSAEITKTSDK